MANQSPSSGISKNETSIPSPEASMLSILKPFLSDSLVGDRVLKDYFFVNMDTTMGDLKIIMEKHVFIESESLEIPLILTKLYHNSKEKQFISVWFYEMS